jgi:hypothetical protein
VSGVPEQGSRGLDLGDHLGAHVLHGLERSDQTIELLALLRVCDRLLDHGLARAKGVGSECNATRVEHSSDRISRAFEYGFRRDACKDHLCGAARGVDGGEARDLESGCVGPHHREPALVDHHEEEIGCAGVERHHRLAVQGTCLDADAGGFAHGEELRHGDAEDEIAAGEAREPAGDLAPRHRCECGGRHDGRGEKGGRRHRMTQRLGDECGIQEREPAAVLRLGHQDARHAELGQRAPDRAVVRAVLPAQLAHALDGHLVREEAPQRLVEEKLIFRESEVHDVPLSSAQAFAGLGSRGSPSPRSAMMFFWIWAVPPPMISPREKIEWACQ